MLSLVRPKALMPIHGEFRMLAAHAQLGRDAGVPADSIVMAENGAVVELTRDGARIVDRIEAGVTFVDGLGVGDVRDVALRDRRHLSEDGVLIIVTTLAMSNGAQLPGRRSSSRAASPSPGLCSMRSAPRRSRCSQMLARQGVTEIKLLQEHLHDAVGQLIYDRTGRRPMILPVIVEV